jgi:hypothetical protein
VSSGNHQAGDKGCDQFVHDKFPFGGRCTERVARAVVVVVQ